MRLKDITVGSKLVYGSPKVLASGDPSLGSFLNNVEVVAVGKFTEVRGPCGQRQYAGPVDGGHPTKVVIKVKLDDTAQKRTGLTHEHWVVSHGWLMSTAEWKLRHAPVVEMRDMVAKWKADLEATRDEISALLQAAAERLPVSKLITMTTATTGWGEARQIVPYLGTAEGATHRILKALRAAERRRYDALCAQHADLLKRDPRTCEVAA